MFKLKRKVIFTIVSLVLVFSVIIGLTLVSLNAATTGTNIMMQVYNVNKNPASNTIHLNFKLSNSGNSQINLSDVKMRYYFSVDTNKTLNFACDWSQVGGQNVQGTFTTINVDGTDRFLEIGFSSSAGMLAIGESIDIHTRAWKDDWSNFNQLNDYSFDPSSNVPVENDKVTGYIGGVLVCGKESTTVNNDAITVSSGDMFEVKLSENASTGYTWHYNIEDKNILQFVSDEFVKPAVTPMPGSPSEHVWRFKALVNGKTKISFDYYKDWEGIDHKINSKVFEIVVDDLPVLNSLDGLRTLLDYKKPTGSDTPSITTSPSPVPAATNAPMSTSDKSSTFSDTNTQVNGIDESDIIKTEGEYIYQVNRDRIIIVKASDMKIVGTLDYTKDDYNPTEMYLYKQKLVVIAKKYTYSSLIMPAQTLLPQVTSAPTASSTTSPTASPTVLPTAAPTGMPIPYYQYQFFTKATVYDVSDKSKISKVRELELEGNYVSSRRASSSLYLVATKNFDSGMLSDGNNLLPTYRDTAVKEDFTTLNYPEIRYFPGEKNYNFMIIAGLDLDSLDKKATLNTYLGNAKNMYMSDKNMYLSSTCYNYITPKINDFITILPIQGYDTTMTYKFALENCNIKYVRKALVPGSILNQFSMDEYTDYFRIATTKGGSVDNLYVLDKNMSIVGSLENIAPGERIYSVRFMGERAYMVTYKTIDPFFVMDLKNPAKPTILGNLKIPGVSKYLHPYDDNHIIGIGQDSVEVNGVAYFLGLKMAMFDVTDVTKPVQMFSEVIGDRGTTSSLLTNHHALLFSKDKNLISFPVDLYKAPSGSTPSTSGVPAYGQFVYQGAYVYDIDLSKGFNLKGSITHFDTGEIESGKYDSLKRIDRIIYIDNTFFTLSNRMIKSNDMTTLKESNSVTIP